MKNRIFIFCSVLAMIVAGCSGVEKPLDQVAPDYDFEQNIYSDVPIEFGYGGTTKAPLTTERLSTTSNFGLFSVKEATDDLRKSEDLNFRNHAMNYYPGVGFRLSGGTYYYPIGSESKYKFYAYYTWQDDPSINAMADFQESAKQTMVRFYSYQREVNGIYRSGVLGSNNGDVIYGKAACGSIDAFNSSVVKRYGNPKFHFQHATAGLYLEIKLKDTPTRDMGQRAIRIVSFEIIDSPAQADLCIVDLDDPSNEGKFFNQVYPANASQNLILRYPNTETINPGGGYIRQLAQSDAGVTYRFGHGYMFIVPQDGPVTAKIVLRRFNLSTGKSEGDYIYELKLDPADYGYRGPNHDEEVVSRYDAGVMYNYTITFDWGSARGGTGPIVVGGKLIQ